MRSIKFACAALLLVSMTACQSTGGTQASTDKFVRDTLDLPADGKSAVKPE